MKPLPSTDLSHLPQAYAWGEVTIHPNAAIAAGVLLQAELNSRIIVEAGVCIGAGTVLHVYEGTLEIRAGATLGSGVLVIGAGSIGAEACIGADTTIFESTIEARHVVPPGSLIGDTSRQGIFSPESTSPASSSSAPVEAAAYPPMYPLYTLPTPALGEVPRETPAAAEPPPELPAPPLPLKVQGPEPESQGESSFAGTPTVSENGNAPVSATAPEPETPALEPAAAEPANYHPVYGREYIRNLLGTLLPHRANQEKNTSETEAKPLGSEPSGLN